MEPNNTPTPNRFIKDWNQTILDPNPKTSPFLHPELIETDPAVRSKFERIKAEKDTFWLRAHLQMLAEGRPGLPPEMLANMGYQPEDFDQPDL